MSVCVSVCCAFSAYRVCSRHVVGHATIERSKSCADEAISKRIGAICLERTFVDIVLRYSLHSSIHGDDDDEASWGIRLACSKSASGHNAYQWGDACQWIHSIKINTTIAYSLSYVHLSACIHIQIEIIHKHEYEYECLLRKLYNNLSLCMRSDLLDRCIRILYVI